jgi:hypothetical protein
MNYTWKLTSLKRKNTSELNNVVVQTHWKKTGTDEDGNTGEFSGATPFDLSTVDPTNFTSYEDLTEEAVLGWIQSVVVGDYERHVNAQIAKQIQDKVSPITEVTGGFPWEPEDEVIEGSSGPAAAAAESVMDVTPTPPV